MENKKELITKNIEEKKETLKKIEELKQERSTKQNELMEIINNTKKHFAEYLNNKELQETINNYKEIENKLSNEINYNYYKDDILQNNLDWLLNEIVQDELIPILKKYQDKKIGTKTKEKIATELDTHIQNNYNIKLYFNFYKEYDFSRTTKITFDFYFNNSCVSIAKIQKAIDDDTPNVLYNYFVNYNYNYIEISKTYDKAKELVNNRRDSKDKIEELKKQIEEIRNNFNENCHNALNNKRIEVLR